MVNTVPEENRRRWQLDIRSLKAGIAHICKSKEFADVTIMVGSKFFKAHRLILVARSPQFSKLLVRDGEAPVSKLNIGNTTEEAFEILLNYIYTDNIPKLDSQDLVLEVDRAATNYGQEGLREACEKIIVEWEITHGTVISILQMSDVQFVRDRCWEYLKGHAAAVLASDGILDATSDTLTEIFERGLLIRIPVIDLLTNVIRWSSRLFPSSPDYLRVREHLLVPNGERHRSLMSWMGLQRLTLEELGVVLNKYPKLINDAEIRMFFQYITAGADNKPELPIWVES